MENRGEDIEVRMDLDLNLGPPSPSRLGLDLGLGPVQLEFGEVQSNLMYSSVQDLDLSTVNLESGESVHMNIDEHRLQESSSLPRESRTSRSTQARYRWRRRHSRTPPEILDLAALEAAHGFRRNSSMGHLLIFSPVDELGISREEGINPLGISSRERAVEVCATCKENAKDLIAKALAGEEEDETKNQASNFECNICLDMAKEPVLTSCGHLFCWPCLYQWLHVHSNTKECPVCKGEVTEMNVTPIYGRGSSTCESEKKIDGKGESDSKVPPRPHANRIESLRQRIHRYSSRQVADALRLGRRHTTSVGEHSGGRADVSEGQNQPRDLDGAGDVLDGIDSATDQILARLRVAQRLQQRERLDQARLRVAQRLQQRDILEQRSHLRRRGLFRNAGTDVLGDRLVTDLPDRRLQRSTFSREGDDGWRVLSFPRLQRSDRMAALSAGLVTVELERYAQSTDATSYPGSSVPVSLHGTHTPPSQSSQQLPGRVSIEDRALVSSTNSIIASESRISDIAVEPDSVASSSPFRRRRSDASGSLDIDHALSRAPKRRRLN